MLQDFDRTQQLVNISMSSAGATAAQHRKDMQGLEAATIALTTSYQKLITNFTNSDIAIAAVRGLSGALDFLGEHMGLVYGIMGAILAMYAPLIASKVSDVITTGLSTIALVLNTKSLEDNSEELKKQELLNNAGIKGLKQKIVLKIAEKLGIDLFTGSLEKENLALVQNNLLTEASANIFKSHPIGAIVAIVLALVAAWWALNKETEAGLQIQEIFKTLLQSIGTLFVELMNVLGPLLELVMAIVGPLIQRTMAQLSFLVNILSIVINVFSSILGLIGDLFKGIKKLLNIKEGGLFSKILDVIGGKGTITRMKNFSDAIKEWTEGIGKMFETAEEKSERLANKISKNQEEIYDNQQRANSLAPLIDEYESLQNKSNKTAEDLERLKEIQKEIGDLDKSYLNSDGSVNWSKVKSEEQKARDAAQAGIKNNRALAIQGMATGVYKEEYRAAITDYYAEQAKEINNISALTASNIAQNYKAVMDSLSSEQFMSLTEGQLSSIYNSVAEMQTAFEGIEDDENRLANEFAAYEKAIQKVPEEAKEAFNSMYSLYANYANMMDQLGLKGQDRTNFLNKMQTLGISEADYQSMMEAYLAANHARTQEDFNKWFAGGMQSGSNKTEILKALLNGSSGNQGLMNAVQSAFLLTNQQALENYTKSANRFNNLQELSQKAKAGTLTLDEWRTLQEENPGLFEDAAALEAFKQGRYDAKKAKQDELKILEDELRAQLIAADIEGDVSMQNLLKEQLEYLKNADLYESEIWKNAANMTAELKRQKQIQSDLTHLQEKYEHLTGQERLDNLKKQAALYKEMYNSASQYLDNPKYKEALDKGYIIDGEVVVTQEELLAEGQNDLWEWLNEYGEQIKTDYDNREKALDGYRSIIQEQYENEKEMLQERKESYQNYFDQVDALEEQQERTQNRRDIINSIAALSGGLNTASARKELLQQLEELNKEEAEARKQEIRDKALNDIDERVQNIDDNIKKLALMDWNELSATIAATEIGASIEFSAPHYKEGGLVDFTGPAWVDGTKNRPEAFLSAVDTALIRQMLDALVVNLREEGGKGGEENNSSIIIDNIIIQAQSMNTKQDFKAAGGELAREFAKIIQERGLNVNVRK